MKKKLIAIFLCVALVAVGVVGATIAYFTDEDKVENNFTIGNIDIDLWENGGVTDEAGKIVQDAVEKAQNGITYENLMAGYKIQKEPVIENTGSQPAYVRVAVLVNNYLKINEAIDEVYENAPYNYNNEKMQALYDNIFDGWGIDYTKNPIRGSMALRSSEIGVDNNGATLLGIDYVRGVSGQYQSGSEGTEYMEGYSYGAAAGKYYEKAYIDDGRLYVFYLKLEPGKSYKLFDGLNVPAEFTQDQAEMFNGLTISIYADAIQTAGFTTAKAAFNALEEAHSLGWWKSVT